MHCSGREGLRNRGCGHKNVHRILHHDAQQVQVLHADGPLRVGFVRYASRCASIAQEPLGQDDVVPASGGFGLCLSIWLFFVSFDGVFALQHRKQMPLVSVSQLLSNTLYGRRFFPFYAFNVLGGVDETGEGFVFGYDGECFHPFGLSYVMFSHVIVCDVKRLETLKR